MSTLHTHTLCYIFWGVWGFRCGAVGYRNVANLAELQLSSTRQAWLGEPVCRSGSNQKKTLHLCMLEKVLFSLECCTFTVFSFFSQAKLTGCRLYLNIYSFSQHVEPSLLMRFLLLLHVRQQWRPISEAASQHLHRVEKLQLSHASPTRQRACVSIPAFMGP